MTASPEPRRSRLRTVLRRSGLLLVLAVLSFVAWNFATRTLVTPLALREAEAPSDRHRAFELWRESIEIANEFLASPFNASMPPGRLELVDDGMRFHYKGETLELRVWNSATGDLAVWSGAIAQECIGGFRVGTRGGDDPHVDHSWFRYPTGSLRRGDQIAKTLLHELAHAVHRTGNFGVVKSLLNYAEIVFLWRTWEERSFERAPQAVDHEFFHWLTSSRHCPARFPKRTVERAQRELRRHLDSPDRLCRHGHAEVWSLTW